MKKSRFVKQWEAKWRNVALVCCLFSLPTYLLLIWLWDASDNFIFAFGWTWALSFVLIDSEITGFIQSNWGTVTRRDHPIRFRLDQILFFYGPVTLVWLLYFGVL